MAMEHSAFKDHFLTDKTFIVTHKKMDQFIIVFESELANFYLLGIANSSYKVGKVIVNHLHFFS